MVMLSEDCEQIDCRNGNRSRNIRGHAASTSTSGGSPGRSPGPSAATC